MNKDKFKKNYMILLATTQVDMDEAYANIVFDVLEKDFTDQEFEYICKQIMIHEDLYNKQPTVKLFYKYRDKIRPNEDIKKKQDFLVKVGNYLSSSFLSTSEVKAFKDNLTEHERRALETVGGISEAYRLVHSDYPTPITKILDRISVFFDEGHKFDTTQIGMSEVLKIGSE